MTNASKLLPKFVVAFSFVFCGIAGVASAAPNPNASRRAQPKLSALRWQGGHTLAATPKTVVKLAVKAKDKRADRSNERRAKRSNERRAKRSNERQAKRHNRKQGDKRLADHKGRSATHSPATPPAQQEHAWHVRRLQKFDSNRDGRLSPAEKAAMKRQRLAGLDTNRNGTISPAEKRAARAKRTRARKAA